MTIIHRGLAAALLVIATCAVAQGAATTVERGDTLSVVIAEAPEMSRSALVDPDGRIMLAGLGGVAVAGRDLDEVRALITQELVSRSMIRSPTVLVEFASWRPFYVAGAVAAPGAFDYAPGLTVRQALATAGGPATPRDAGPEPTLSAAEVLAEARATEFRLLQVDGRIARLRAELGIDDAAVAAETETRQVPPAEAAVVQALENGLQKDRETHRQDQKSHLETVLDLVALESEVLEQQADLQIEEQTQQREEIAAARTLQAKGLIAKSILSERLRDGSRLSRDILENQAFAARARQEEATTRYEMAAAETQRRIGLRNDLSAALTDRATLTERAEVLSARLLAGGLALDTTGAPVAPVAEVTIHRVVAGAPVEVSATMETEVRPGDVLDVAFATAVGG